MLDQVQNRFSLAADAVTAAFMLIARHASSSGVMDIIDINRRLETLKDGDENVLRCTLQSLHVLAGSPQLFSIRMVMTALAQSLPRMCSTQASSNDIHIAALDLEKFASEAESLRAPDIAARVRGITAAMIEQNAATRMPTIKDSVH